MKVMEANKGPAIAKNMPDGKGFSNVPKSQEGAAPGEPVSGDSHGKGATGKGTGSVDATK
jgi:hypothetical protein